jgi:hypothetical protein
LVSPEFLIVIPTTKQLNCALNDVQKAVISSVVGKGCRQMTNDKGLGWIGFKCRYMAST